MSNPQSVANSVAKLTENYEEEIATLVKRVRDRDAEIASLKEIAVRDKKRLIAVAVCSLAGWLAFLACIMRYKSH